MKLKGKKGFLQRPMGTPKESERIKYGGLEENEDLKKKIRRADQFRAEKKEVMGNGLNQLW